MKSPSTSSSSSSSSSCFPIPSSLHDLEREPYNLLPYPSSFDDVDEAARADSFDLLVDLIDEGNSVLTNSVFDTGDEAGFSDWISRDRMQALYTLVRKSSSLAAGTKGRFISLLCKALRSLCSMLEDDSTCVSNNNNSSNDTNPSQSNAVVMPQSFRDAFACHLYLLYSIMFVFESEAKHSSILKTKATPKSKKKKATRARNSDAITFSAESPNDTTNGQLCAKTLVMATRAMCHHKSKLWKRGVPDESVVSLPCRIAYPMLERSRGVTGRKAARAEEALIVIACTVDSYGESLLSTTVAALVDLLHSYEHMAPLVAELCTLVSDSRLAVELLREVGRLDTGSVYENSNSATALGGKASGIKFVAPFISELSQVMPKLLLGNISLVLCHLDSEPYFMRNSIITGIGHILIAQFKDNVNDHTDEGQNIEDENPLTEGELDANDDRSDKPEKRAPKNSKTNRDALLDILSERVHDKSSFTRVAALRALASLVDSGSLPLDRIMSVTALAIDRLNDKTVLVRRGTLALLTLILENNPYMSSLDLDKIIAKIAELEVYLKDNMPAHLKTAKENWQKDTEGDMEEGDDSERDAKHEEFERAALAAAIAETMNASQLDLTDAEREYLSKVKALQFATSAVAFIDLFENANEAFESMLLSRNKSDVTEALKFFVRAKQFSLPSATSGMKQALVLMWSTESDIRDEVLRAFIDVFIAVPGTDGAELLEDKQIAHNLLVLTGQASVSELASIEQAIGQLVEKEIIPAETFLILWSVASKSTGEARAAAMSVLAMGAKKDPTIVDSSSRLRLLLEAGLGDYAEEHRDWKTAKSACCAVQQLKSRPQRASAKSIVLELIIERLSIVACGAWCRDDNLKDTMGWFCASEEAINALFAICPTPEKISADIIRYMEASIFGMDSGFESASTGSQNNECSILRLARFFFVIGHIALKLLVNTEEVSGYVRRANAEKALAKQEAADKAKQKAIAKNKNKTKTPKKRATTEIVEHGDTTDEEDIEAELGVAAEAEAENEQKMEEISEKEIVGRGLIGLFGPLLVRVVDNAEGNFSHYILRQSATLALCKFMSISSQFCDKHLPLLFSTIQSSPNEDTILRSNTAVALGDLAFRFPNQVEPYTPKIYAMLRDNSTKVRRHTLMVLTHLILHGMIKVKGQVCEIAMCLEDKEARIRDMARLLFRELSKRSNNPIYNLLPDIISQLSQLDIPKKVFRNIMSFLLGFIEKDKQNEMLAYKLIHRFKGSSISHQGDLAYCISQLKINVRCIKILSDQFKLYKDSLYDETVFESFANIITKSKKTAGTKAEMKEPVEELEKMLSTANSSGMENHIAGNKAERAKARANKRNAKAVGKKKGNKKIIPEWEESDEEEDGGDLCDSEDDTPMKGTRTPMKGTKTPIKGKENAIPRSNRLRRVRG